ncbi:ubiquitin-protein transferase [Diaporthe amygdali]|uniref:ubiquitin-protein transferase n=1 Tax=Phomopsis amygdali TaxID=1214568 RepID=UPI0022FEB0DF|nr:ubiquitin-protein transferase [Diaporthe amygdali]KAJ0118484.1 ubiquitin-protein transferase [Diaporthe amygdali]
MELITRCAGYPAISRELFVGEVDQMLDRQIGAVHTLRIELSLQTRWSEMLVLKRMLSSKQVLTSAFWIH